MHHHAFIQSLNWGSSKMRKKTFSNVIISKRIFICILDMICMIQWCWCYVVMLCYVMFICYEMGKRCCHVSRSGVVRICCVRFGVIIIWEENEERAKKKVNKSAIKDVRNEIELITRHDNGIEENRCSNALIHFMKWNKHNKKWLQNTLDSIEIIEQK